MSIKEHQSFSLFPNVSTTLPHKVIQNQHWYGGNRKLEFVGNHVHGWKSTFARFTGDFATNKGAIISGNQLDIGGTLVAVDGKGMSGAVITGNVVGNSSGTFEDRSIIDVDAREFVGNVISGNSFFGVDDVTDTSSEGKPVELIMQFES